LYYTFGHNYCNSIIIEGLRIISVYRRVARATALRLASTLRLLHTIASVIRYWSLSTFNPDWDSTISSFYRQLNNTSYCWHCFSSSHIAKPAWSVFIEKWLKLYFQVPIVFYLLIVILNCCANLFCEQHHNV